MTNLTPEFLARLRALAEAATPLSGAVPLWPSGLAQDHANGLLMATSCPPTVLALVEAAEIGLEARRRMELGRTWRSALTCGCIFEDPYDPDLCTRSCDHHAGLLAEIERLRAEIGRPCHSQCVRSPHAHAD